MIPKPTELKQYLDTVVIGQDEAKKVLSVAVYNHYKRISIKKRGQVCDNKANVILSGPSGSGKTLLLNALASKLNVPFVTVDATSYTAAGYHGNDVTDMISMLNPSNGRARGIIFIDEVDKLASGTQSDKSEVGTRAVQQALLKMIEGGSVEVKKMFGSTESIDTSEILFVLGGAFVGLSAITTKRGGSAPNHSDFIKFGMIPELVGRCPVLTNLLPLDAPTLARIIVEPTDSLFKQYSRLLEAEGATLKLSKGVAEMMAEKALKNKTGARGLRTIFEDLLLDVMFELPSRDDIVAVKITQQSFKSNKVVLVKGKHKKEVENPSENESVCTLSILRETLRSTEFKDMPAHALLKAYSSWCELDSRDPTVPSHYAAYKFKKHLERR